MSRLRLLRRIIRP